MALTSLSAAEPRSHHTLQPGDLVHEYVMIARKSNVSYPDRRHFFAFASRVMRHILVDHERERSAQKRWGHLDQIPLEDVKLPAANNSSLIILRQLLKKLETIYPTACRILELTESEGLSLKETAAAMGGGLSTSTVKRNLRFARAWLHVQWSKDRGKAGQS